LAVIACAPMRVTLQNTVQTQLTASREMIKNVIAKTDSVDLIALLGCRPEDSNTGFEASDSLALEMLDTCEQSTNSAELPPLIMCPGRGDISDAARSTAGARVLSAFWHDINESFWQSSEGQEHDSVRLGFEEFVSHAAQHFDSLPNMIPGFLPGDLSAQLPVQGGSIGLLVLNTCFRSIQAGVREPGTLHKKQFDTASGGSYADWARDALVIYVVTSDPFRDLDDQGRRVLREMSGLGPPIMQLSSSSGLGPLVHDNGRSLTEVFLRQGVSSNVDFELNIGAVECDPPEARVDYVGIHAEQSKSPVGSARFERWRMGAGTAVAVGGTKVQTEDIARNAIPAFQKELATGRMVLVLGSALRNEFVNSLGRPLPSQQELAEALNALYERSGWSGSALPLREQFETSLRRLGRNVVEDLLASTIVPCEAADESCAQVLLSAPWARVYKLGIDPLTIDNDRHPRGEETSFVNCLTNFGPYRRDRLEIAHLRGIAPRVSDFDLKPFVEIRGEGDQARWLGRFQADVRSHPSLFVLDDPHEFDAWWCMTLRDATEVHKGPGTYLVCHGLDENEREHLAHHGVLLLSDSVTSFVTTQLAPGREVVAEGIKSLQRRRATFAGPIAGTLLEAYDTPEHLGTKEYLLGREPTWGDVRQGYAVELSILDQFKELQAADEAQQAITIVKGRAGVGKSTTLMQYALSEHRNGRYLLWVDRTFTAGISDLRKQVKQLDPSLVVIDDADLFGTVLPDLLRDLNEDGRRSVVAGIRNNRYNSLIGAGLPHTVFSHDFRLTDRDMTELISRLERAGLLGRLRGFHTALDRLMEFQRVSDSEILIGLLEVTRGKRFEELIRDEFFDHGPVARRVYASVAFVTSYRKEILAVAEESVIEVAANDGDYQAVVDAIEELVHSKLLIRTSNGVRVYHPVAGERVVASLRNQPDELKQIVEGLLTYYAAIARSVEDSRQPDRRIMIGLLSHSTMAGLGLHPRDIDDIYESARTWLEEDFHYWLQRGAYHVEIGDFGLARNYLTQARSLPRGIRDHFVATEWNCLALKEAATNPGTIEQVDEALAAIRELEAICRTQRQRSAPTFAVLVRDGTEWLAKDPLLTRDQRADVLRAIRGVLELGDAYLAGNAQYEAAARNARVTLSRLDPPSTQTPFPT
jgi:hypothetical protein